MVTPAAGEVVLVPFPFSDLSQSKVRPAICLADAEIGFSAKLRVVRTETRRRYRWTLPTFFAAGGLLVTSFARPGKLFTAHSALMVRSVGILTPAAFARVLSAVVALLQP